MDLGLNIVGLQVQVHPFLGDLLVVGALEQHPDLGVRESEQSAVDGAALLREWLLGGVEGGRPERDPVGARTRSPHLTSSFAAYDTATTAYGRDRHDRSPWPFDSVT